MRCRTGQPKTLRCVVGKSSTMRCRFAGGLEGFLGLPGGADRGRFGGSRDEPVALVVAAEELVLLAALPNQEEQVPFGGLDVKDGDLGGGSRLPDDLEELALAVALHVQGDDAGAAGAAGGAIGHLQPGADA